jgi:hypothetical protein
LGHSEQKSQSRIANITFALTALLQAPSEAEAQCAELVKAGKVRVTGR